MLPDRQGERIAGQIIRDERTRGSSGRDSRMFMEAVQRVIRTEAPFATPFDVFVSWNSILSPLQPTKRQGYLWQILASISDHPDFDHLIVVSARIRARLHDPTHV